VYLDDCEVHLHSRLAKVWQTRGRPMRGPAAGADRTFAIFVALDYATGRVRWQHSLHKESTAFVAFLEQLRHAWPHAKLMVVLK
jgi:DDE superfamily endonuclease